MKNCFKHQNNIFQKHLRGKGQKDLIYLFLRNGVLHPTNLVVHNKPSIQELVDASVFNADRHHVHIGYRHEWTNIPPLEKKSSHTLDLVKAEPGMSKSKRPIQSIQSMKSDKATTPPLKKQKTEVTKSTEVKITSSSSKLAMV